MTNRTEVESFPTAARRSTTFVSLRTRNFRLLATSSLFTNTAYWMGYTAQNWLVLSLTDSAADVGVTAALLFLPTLVLGLAGGVLADRYSKRHVVLFGCIGWASLTTLFVGLTLSHVVQVWQVQVIAAGLGTLNALCWPAQQAFIAEMIEPAQLRNAISINASGTQLAVLAGPAVGGILISAVGPGGAFFVAAVCYALPIMAMTRIRTDELLSPPVAPAQRGQLGAGLRYAVSRQDVLWPTILIAFYGMFTGNISVTLAVYAKSVFDLGPGGYGLLIGIVAVGALISARQHRSRLRTLMLFAALLSTLYIVSAIAPTRLVFCAVLLGIGSCTLLLQTSAASTVQLAANDSIRGRVVGIYLLAWSGGIALGGPLVGNVDQHLGPHAGMLLAGMLPGTVTLLIAARLAIGLLRSRRSTAQSRVTPSPNTPTCEDAPKKTTHGNGV